MDWQTLAACKIRTTSDCGSTRHPSQPEQLFLPAEPAHRCSMGQDHKMGTAVPRVQRQCSNRTKLSKITGEVGEHRMGAGQAGVDRKPAAAHPTGQAVRAASRNAKRTTPCGDREWSVIGTGTQGSWCDHHLPDEPASESKGYHLPSQESHMKIYASSWVRVIRMERINFGRVRNLPF